MSKLVKVAQAGTVESGTGQRGRQTVRKRSDFSIEISQDC